MAENKENMTSEPTAPYNFVSFTDAVLVSPLNAYVRGLTEIDDVHKNFRSYLEEKQIFSGHFDIEIENLTPFYIGDDDGFFSISKNLCVPGSSMRGCIKNIFKIITASSFRSNDNFPDGDVKDGNLYFRSFASSHDEFKYAYVTKMTSIDEQGKSHAVANAGFLVRIDKDYYICPANYTREKAKNDKQANPEKLTSYRWENDKVTVYTGKIDNKKRYYIFNEPDWKVRHKVPEKVITEYEADTRRNGINLLCSALAKKKETFGDYELLDGADEFDSVIPCFYVTDENGVTSFGSGPYYRVPYDKSIGSHIPEALKTMDVDFTDAVFGNNKWWSSRVYFDDLYLKPGESGKILAETKLALMSPNPTSFQNYLCASGDDSNHWDTDAKLRGYKMYWHRKPDLSVGNNGNSNVVSSIRALDKGNKFEGRIRFDNLRAEELGALAKVLELCNDETKRCFKLGKGKPYGLGCIRLRVKNLFVKDPSYYENLFDANGFNEAKSVTSKVYVDAFGDFIRNSFDETQMISYEHSINELKTIMDSSFMDQAEWNERTKYLNPTDKGIGKTLINERKPLPTIEKVVQLKK